MSRLDYTDAYNPIMKLALFSCAVILLAGCGLKDDLYLPSKPAAVPPATPVNADQDDDKKPGEKISVD